MTQTQYFGADSWIVIHYPNLELFSFNTSPEKKWNPALLETVSEFYSSSVIPAQHYKSGK